RPPPIAPATSGSPAISRSGWTWARVQRRKLAATRMRSCCAWTSRRSTPTQTHAISDLGLAARRHLDVEGEGGCVLLFEGNGRVEHRPVATDRLVVLDFDRGVLVVADFDFPAALRGAAAERAPLHLLAIPDDVEGLTHLDAQLFVAWRVVDLVFT